MLRTLALLVVVAGVAAAGAAPPPGLDAFLASAQRRDPLAVNDSYSDLPSSVKRSISSSVNGAVAPSALLSFSVSVPVTVHLVGPSFSSATAHDLATAVAAAEAVKSSPFISASAPHQYAVRHSLHLDVVLASGIADRVQRALKSHLGSSPAPFHPKALSSVPYSVVDSVISSHFRNEISSSFHVYLINVGPQERPYAYANENTGDISLGYNKCFGTIWMGVERYLWIDLSAGPVDYGPVLSGDGLIPKGEFHPLATAHGRPKSEKRYAADLAALVVGAYKALLVPTVRIPVYYENSLVVHFVHVVGSRVKDPVGLNWDSVEQAIRDGHLASEEQKLEFKKFEVEMDKCPICSFAVARSMNSFTSRFLFENYTLIVNEYLDSKRMRQVLTDASEEVNRIAGIGEDYGRVIPVFVFDLESDKLLLLDRYHQAVAFRDMVIAVRTRATQTVSDYSCNGRHVITQTRNLERPIIGSLLQSVWGVSPTHSSWSPEHNETVVDYTWSVGQTPFGPFSESKSLSFVQRDAARRNVLITSLNYTITSAFDMYDSLATHGGEKILMKKHAEFFQRWGLMMLKLEKVVSALSRLDYDKAEYFLRSSDHDLYAIHTLVYEATQEVEAALVCFEDPPFPWMTVSISGAFILGFVYIYAKRDKLFTSKRKQF